MNAEINKHRVFFALLPDDEIAAHLLALGHHVAARGGGRLMPVHNLHLTLAFMGSVTSVQMDTMIACAHTVSDAFIASVAACQGDGSQDSSFYSSAGCRDGRRGIYG